ncbi:hypothetical protein M0P65_06055 [Candidatus Gracilibacteria bacterium]|jgi:hypothetical protein|nr:hypothetical protein [Candidatus Gracilibacteria bacterium]
MKQLELGEIRNGFPVLEKKDRETLLLLADDIQFHSGVATIARQVVLGTCHYFNWVQLGGAMKHPHEGKKVNIDIAVANEIGLKDPSVEIFCISGYGSPHLVRDILHSYDISAIFHITDPRFWNWLYSMRAELETICPVIYLDLWDCPPVPAWNEPFYRSSDLLLNINRQTHQFVKTLLKDNVFDLYKSDYNNSLQQLPKLIDYVPHGQDENTFFKINKTDEKVVNLKKEIFNDKADDIKFICFYNNRNIRRKMLIDLIIAYRDFCLDDEKKINSTALILHTDAKDENGTDLSVVINDLANELNIIIIEKKISPQEMNVLYNLSDVTINIGSNEGFGLSSLESIMTETMIINNTTGGLQDQMRFEDENGRWIEFTEEFPTNHNGRYKKCGEWAIPIFPKTRSIQGSIPTPYIFDDRCDWEDVSKAILKVYEMSQEEREIRGKKGREWVLSKESRMSTTEMSHHIIMDINLLLEKWIPTRTIEMINVNKELEKKKTINMGILKSEL